jgi:hypothetical protein
MSLLREVREVRQVPGEFRRRWFSSHEMDLIVWYDEADHPAGFQICYDLVQNEHALTWKPESGFRHHAVDGGDDARAAGFYKGTPVLVANGAVDFERIRVLFAQANANLPGDITEFVNGRLLEEPAGSA